jgi:hypothetical protein
MKKIIKSATFLMFILSQMSYSQIWDKKEIKGNNNYITQNIKTNEYDKLSVSGSINVEFVSGTEGDLQLKIEENLVEYIEIATKNSTLSIKIKNNTYINNNKEIVVIVPVKDISEINLAGSSNISSKTTLNSDKLNINVAGSGDMTLAVNAKILNTKVAGSGSLTLNGKANDCDFNVMGSGEFNGEKLTCEDVSARVAGSGDCRFICTKTLKAYVVGSGSIQYSGNPEVLESKALGSGSIDKLR